MTVVVDCGCANWGTERSVDRLIERFHPETLHGFDPYPEVHDDAYEKDGTLVVIRNDAAWTHTGRTWLTIDGTRSRIEENGSEGVACFDLAEWLIALDAPVILKLDVEGAEHVLLPHLITTGAIEKVSLLLVEFHGIYEGPPLTIPWEIWT